MRHAARARALLLAAAVAAACGEPGEPDASPTPPPISGAAIDAIRAQVRARLERDPGFEPAEHLRLERTEDGARVVVHVTLARELDEQAYTGLCETIAAAAANVLVEGQSQEVYFLTGDAVVHSCRP